MPLRPPALDDRAFDDLVEELLARIPAHTPEWTNPRPGDPGRTILELFAWLTETLLYRVNLIPERQRLAFLRLLGEGMRPAVPARGLVSVAIDDDAFTGAVHLAPGARIDKPSPFETRSELTVLPVSAECYVKRPLTDGEAEDQAATVEGLRQIYGLDGAAVPYVTSPVFPGGTPERDGVDLIRRAVDRSLWLALLAPKPESVEAVRTTLRVGDDGARRLLSVGVSPTIAVPGLFEEVGPRARLPHVWELSTSEDGRYVPLDVKGDSSAGLTRQGVLRLALPADETIGAPSNDPRRNLDAGVGDRPPRLDDPRTAGRLVCWLRLRPGAGADLAAMALSAVLVNAVEVDGRQTTRGRIVGESDGRAGQTVGLPATSVETTTLELQVEEPGLGYQPWVRTEDLLLAGRDDRVYELDPEAGTVRFGDGVRGRIPEPGMRVRVALMRAGGGRAGNLPPGSLSGISAVDLDDRPVTTRLKVTQTLPTEGGQDAESLAEAEGRIPALLRHRDRAVTAEDYRRLAPDTPGTRIGRVEVLPRFKTHQRRRGVPGVVSVMVLPQTGDTRPPNPRPDRPLIERVFAHLDARRPLGTELYVIGCEYVPLAVAVGVTIRDGFAAVAPSPNGHGPGPNGARPGAPEGLDRDGVLRDVREALRSLLWPLTPGGPDGTGWPLGRTVRDRELEVAVARVPGVGGVLGLNLFAQRDGRWQLIAPPFAPPEIRLEPWQLPELLAVAVVADQLPPEDPGQPAVRPTGPAGIAIPVVPELC